ncbi:MAG: hypothetical protein U0470_10095 [Anaerolineae bacterium]
MTGARTRPLGRTAAVLIRAAILAAVLSHGRGAATSAQREVEPASRLWLPLAARGADARDLPPASTAQPTARRSATPSPPPTSTASPTGTPTSAPVATATPTAPPTPAVAVDGSRVTTAHYDLVVDGLDGADIGRMLETAFPQWSAFFGRAPDGRLPGKIFGTLDGMKAAMAADGLTYGGGGGYYHPANRTFYAFAQPSAFFTRMLILHEATHQFHFLAATGNQGYSGFWYGEGLAEHFGMHNWDGTRLSMGIIPAISLEDYPRPGARRVRRARPRPRRARRRPRRLDAGQRLGRVASWLVDERPAGAAALFDRLNRREDLVSSWTAVFGSVGDVDGAAYRAWLTRRQQPWREVWRAVEQRGDVLVAASGVNALAVRKAAVDAPSGGSARPRSSRRRSRSSRRPAARRPRRRLRRHAALRRRPAPGQPRHLGVPHDPRRLAVAHGRPRPRRRPGPRRRPRRPRGPPGGWRRRRLDGRGKRRGRRHRAGRGACGLNVDGCTVAFREVEAKGRCEGHRING